MNPAAEVTIPGNGNVLAWSVETQIANHVPTQRAHEEFLREAAKDGLLKDGHSSDETLDLALGMYRGTGNDIDVFDAAGFEPNDASDFVELTESILCGH